MVDAETLFELLHVETVKQMHDIKSQDGKNEAFSKLERMGFRVGLSLIERFTKDTPRFKDELEMMKYICKDLWMQLYKKQVDNLRTNHQGIYVLQDNNFKILSKISANKQYQEEALKFLAFPCGLIRGACAGLGTMCNVSPELTGMPACKFTVIMQKT